MLRRGATCTTSLTPIPEATLEDLMWLIEPTLAKLLLLLRTYITIDLMPRMVSTRMLQTLANQRTIRDMTRPKGRTRRIRTKLRIASIMCPQMPL